MRRQNVGTASGTKPEREINDKTYSSVNTFASLPHTDTIRRVVMKENTGVVSSFHYAWILGFRLFRV